MLFTKNIKFLGVAFFLSVTVYEIVRVLYGKTIDVILTAENQSNVRIKKRTVNAPCSS